MINKCGECNACCRAAPIPALEKPAWTLCKHYCNGCSIYEDRPSACSTFKCLWLMQDIDVKYRPDKLGVIFEKPYGYSFWIGVETTENALASNDCANIVKALEKDGSVCMLESITGQKQYNLLEGMTKDDFLEMYNTSVKNSQEKV